MERRENIAYIWGLISGICFMSVVWAVIDAMSK